MNMPCRCMWCESVILLILNPLNTELNPICHLLVLLGAHLNLYNSRIRVNLATKCT
jgi:hypothetical protein